MKARSFFFIAALALAPLATGCQAKATADTSKTATLHVHAEAAAAVERPMPKLVPLTGTLEADQRTELTANATGRVVKTFVERGQKIAKGAIVAQLDVRTASLTAQEAAANLDTAKTTLDTAQADCARYNTLLAKGAITQQEYDRQSSTCRQNQSALAAIEAKQREAAQTIGDGTIRAPFAGVVSERSINVGDYVKPESKVATLVVTDPLRLKITVPEKLIPLVQIGQIVTFKAEALPDKSFTGTIKYLGGEVRATTRDLVVEAIVQNSNDELVPGMFVTLDLNAGDEPRVVVPKTALVPTGTDKSVFVVKDGHLVQHIVQLGVDKGEIVAIENGVTKGDMIVVHPTDAMADGAIVD